MKITFTNKEQKINRSICIDDNLSSEQVVKVVRLEVVKLKNKKTNLTSLFVKSPNMNISLTKKDIEAIERVVGCEETLSQEFNFKDE